LVVSAAKDLRRNPKTEAHNPNPPRLSTSPGIVELEYPERSSSRHETKLRDRAPRPSVNTRDRDSLAIGAKPRSHLGARLLALPLTQVPSRDTRVAIVSVVSIVPIAYGKHQEFTKLEIDHVMHSGGHVASNGKR